MTIRPPGRLTFLLVGEALALGILRLASDVHFEWFAFFDGGAELAAHAMMARGLRPTSDFGYIYGLLPLAAGEVWYGLFGLSPGAFAAACLMLDGLMAWGLARLLRSLGVGRIGVAWVVVAMPIGLISAAPPNLTHALEPAILAHALADIAGGRLRRALALATLCAFVKPSMAYLLGLGVLAILFTRDRTRSMAEVARRIAPAFVLAIGAGLLLAMAFGPVALARSLFPIAGRAVYRANRFGLFAAGRAFWVPPRPGLRYYFLDSFAGAWLAANAVLTLAAIRRLFARRESSEPEARRREGDRMIFLCAILHGAFLAFFFGNPWSWVYYVLFLVAGIAAISTSGRAGACAAALVTVLAIPWAERSIRGPIEAWGARARSIDGIGVWASESVRRDWEAVTALVRGRRVALLATTDGACLFDADFGPPEVTFLVRGHWRPAELERKLARIRIADAVVVANPAPGEPWFDAWPEFAGALRGFRRAWSSARLRVYLRTGPRPPPGLTAPIAGRYDPGRTTRYGGARPRTE